MEKTNFILRDYQKEAVKSGIKALKKFKNKAEILVLPTGSGKSLIIANICLELKTPTLILQPSKEILEQNYAKLLSYGIKDIGIFSASVGRKEVDNKFTYATIQSIYKNPKQWKHIKNIIIDECHLVNPKKIDSMFIKFFKGIGNPKIIGLTATPYRIVQRYTKEGNDLFYESNLVPINRIHPFFFSNIAYKIQNKELFDRNFLCKIKYRYRNNGFNGDLIKKNTTGADFNKEALEKYMNSNKQIANVCQAVNDYNSYVKHILIFNTSIKSAENTKKKLNEIFGIESEVITGKDNKKTREKKLNDFRNGKIKILLNVGVLTIGYDFPELDCIILARPTRSLALYYQILGRGIRISKGKEFCAVIDCTDTVERLGRIETIFVGTEADGFKTAIYTEVGMLSMKRLFKWKITKKEKKNKILKKK
ncbi:MAG: DEAD/DEAH box helicase [Deltaproteobacteria bacterium]|nr:DEAD/DEAH box helicase [Deltaproteobacteria bacterium]